MSYTTDGTGTASESGQVAMEIAKNAAPVDNGHFAEGSCLNCGTKLNGKHCHECGQKAHLHRTIGAFLHDLLHGALHLDGKVWRTLPLLIFKPGRLTRRYIDGERTSLVSPIALFLFSVFLMFVVFQSLGISAPTDLNTPTSTQVSAGLDRKLSELETSISSAEAELETGELTAARREELERQLAQDRQEFEQLGTLRELPLIADEGKSEESSASNDQVNMGLDEDGVAQVTSGGTGVAWIDAALEKWRTNPSLMLYKMQANAYKFAGF